MQPGRQSLLREGTTAQTTIRNHSKEEAYARDCRARPLAANLSAHPDDPRTMPTQAYFVFASVTAAALSSTNGGAAAPRLRRAASDDPRRDQRNRAEALAMTQTPPVGSTTPSTHVAIARCYHSGAAAAFRRSTATHMTRCARTDASRGATNGLVPEALATTQLPPVGSTTSSTHVATARCHHTGAAASFRRSTATHMTRYARTDTSERPRARVSDERFPRDGYDHATYSRLHIHNIYVL